MLLHPETEERVNDIIEAMASAFAIFAIGRDLQREIVLPAKKVIPIPTASSLSFLDLAYLAGKMTDLIGQEKVREMSPKEIQEWTLSNNVVIEKSDQVMVAQLRDTTARWLTAKLGDWKRETATEINRANRQWTAQLQDGGTKEDREIAVEQLTEDLEEDVKGFAEDMNTLIATETFSYFQWGQTTNAPGSIVVYKVPRLAACVHCLRLHLNGDGSPKNFVLHEIKQQNNWGKGVAQWKPTVGPTHPNCYCPLFRTDQTPNPGPDAERARARQEAMNKPLRKAARSRQLRRPTEDKPYFTNLLEFLSNNYQIQIP